MNFKNKYAVTFFLIIILTIGFLYYYSSTKTENKIPESIKLTEEQKLEVLSQMSNVSAPTISEAEKEKILNQATTGDKPAQTLSREEILQFLNKTN